jgi:aldehyde:ferredoxin oxidoreductase
MKGVHGRFLRVALPSLEAEVVPLPPSDFALAIGGGGLASLLLLRHCPPGADPLGADNPLVLASSPFAGTGITTAAKLAVAARSPQTGMVGDSLSSSYLALALKRTGFDAVVVTGHAAEWSLLVIDDDRLSLLPAGHLLGRDPAQTAAAVRADLGGGFRVAAVGVAGEHAVRYAAIANDGRLAGRTGTGAVLGSKRLKAIAVRGSRPAPVADPRGLAAAARLLAERSLGPETAKYREVGTAANVAFFDRIGTLPTHNFQQGSFAGADAISGETLLLEHGTDRHACAACTVGCEHRYRTIDNGPAIETRLEYETLFALGSLCGVSDPNTVLRAAARCDALGIDAISAGGTVAWAMECREHGVDLSPWGGPAPTFGDGEALLAALDATGHRRGLGNLLAEGSRRAAEVVGQGSDGWAMHVKGLELPGYDPRKLKTMALGLAVATRGACHNRSSAYEADLSDALAPAAADAARAAAAVAAEDQAALLDSLTVCKFLRHVFADLPEETATLHRLVTGEPTTADSLLRSAATVTAIKKTFNQRMGWTRALDTLPGRLTAAVEESRSRGVEKKKTRDEKRETRGENEGNALDPSSSSTPRLLDSSTRSDSSTGALARLVDAYYAARGWGADGTVPPDPRFGPLSG